MDGVRTVEGTVDEIIAILDQVPPLSKRDVIRGVLWGFAIWDQTPEGHNFWQNVALSTGLPDTKAATPEEEEEETDKAYPTAI